MRRWITFILLAGIVLTVAGAACNETTQRPRTVDALGKMEVAFEGNYTRGQIKPVLDQAMTLYSLPITEENYLRAANVLVVMRQENGVNEMDILSYMIRSHVPGVNLAFSEIAAISAVFLAAGDK